MISCSLRIVLRVLSAFELRWATARPASVSAERIEMITITTISSTSVKPRRAFGAWVREVAM